MQVRQTAVIGAGTMGASIAVAFISRDLPVLLKDTDPAALETGMGRIEKALQSQVKRGLSEEDAAKRKALVKAVLNYDDFGQVDLAVEAVLEKLEVKKAVFQDLEAACPAHAILASNTSSLPISAIAAFTKNPQRVLGLHFFNPAHIMKLVEVIPGLETDPDTLQAAMDFVSHLGKLPVQVDECPSFLVNRLLARYMNESLYCLQSGLAGVEEIDQAVVDYVMPIGPLALRDMNGADIGLAVATFNESEYGERFKVPSLLGKMVENKWLGQKTGKGFYLYDDNKKRLGPNPDLVGILPKTEIEKIDPAALAERMFLPMINEAFIAVQEQVCRIEDLDPALIAGLGMRKGPLALAEQIGLPECLAKLSILFQRGEERFRPAPLLKRYVAAGRDKVFNPGKIKVTT